MVQPVQHEVRTDKSGAAGHDNRRFHQNYFILNNVKFCFNSVPANSMASIVHRFPKAQSTGSQDRHCTGLSFANGADINQDGMVP
jgi:hypothetical protein